METSSRGPRALRYRAREKFWYWFDKGVGGEEAESHLTEEQRYIIRDDLVTMRQGRAAWQDVLDQNRRVLEEQHARRMESFPRYRAKEEARVLEKRDALVEWKEGLEPVFQSYEGMLVPGGTFEDREVTAAGIVRGMRTAVTRGEVWGGFDRIARLYGHQEIKVIHKDDSAEALQLETDKLLTYISGRREHELLKEAEVRVVEDE